MSRRVLRAATVVPDPNERQQVLNKIETEAQALQQGKLTLHACKVYIITKYIPAGKVTTYGAISDLLHSDARAVGSALRNNPFAPEIPCHRVVGKNNIGGYFGKTSGINIDNKLLLLQEEGVLFNNDNALASCVLSKEDLIKVILGK